MTFAWILVVLIGVAMVANAPRTWHEIGYLAMGLGVSKVLATWFVVNDIWAVFVILMLSACALGRLRYRQAAAIDTPSFIDFSRGMVLALLPIVLFRAFVFDYGNVPSSSMRPMIAVGDSWLVNKYAYGLHAPFTNKVFWTTGRPSRGDVAFFRYPQNEMEIYVKRVVGVPGDVVSYRSKKLSINGRAVPHVLAGTYTYTDETLGRTTVKTYQEQLGGKSYLVAEMADRPDYMPGSVLRFSSQDQCQYNQDGFTCKVPAGHYFMMGDNRDNSSDSRYWGFVSDQQLVGRVTGRLFRTE